MKRVGKLAVWSLVYFEIVTTLALAVGLLAVNLVRPGAGVSLGVVSHDVVPGVRLKKWSSGGTCPSAE
jgi:Na+/H+-dicarboxylate symporter